MILNFIVLVILVGMLISRVKELEQRVENLENAQPKGGSLVHPSKEQIQ